MADITRISKAPIPQIQQQPFGAVREVLESRGEPLDLPTRAFLEPRFGHDFSQVRVHTGSQAAASARAIEALAYTVGQKIVFGAGQYAPGTPDGRRLIAHELTHTLQQGADQTLAEQVISQSGEPAEQEANTAANLVLQGQNFRPNVAARTQIARK